MFQHGERVYASNGCVYCHSQQVRPDYEANDIERKWGNRRSAPRDYIFERSVFLGKMRMGQDLANIGARAPAQEEGSPAPPTSASPAPQGATASSPPPAQAVAASPATSPMKAASPSAPTAAAASSPGGSPSPNASPPPGQRTGVASPSPGQMANTTPGGSSPVAPTAQTPGAPWPIQTAGLPPLYSAAWHHVHLYAPRSINLASNMPTYRFLYETRRIGGERSADVLQLSGADAPAEGWEVVPSYDAKCLVAYLMGLNQSHPLKDVRSVSGAPAAGASPAAAAQGASPSPAAVGSPAPAKK